MAVAWRKDDVAEEAARSHSGAMDMNLDSKRIRAERERRALSQEHLAEAAGIGLRTIQRVETTGVASYETAKALAAVFECDVARLQVVNPPAVPGTRAHRALLAALAASMLVVVSIFFSRAAIADQVRLDVLLRMNDQASGTNRIVTADGKDAEIRLGGQMRVVVTPRVTADGSILLAVRLDEYSAGRWALVGTPSLLALNDTAAELRLTSVKGTVFSLVITPHKI